MRQRGRLLHLLGGVSIAIILAGLSHDGNGRQESAGGPELCQGYYLSEAAGRHQLAEFARRSTSAAEWTARARRVREGILKGAGLLPSPPKSALNPLSAPVT
jgi:hypothetical protein